MHAVISRPTELDESQRSTVLRLAAEVDARDGAPPLSDQALSRLGSAEVVHLTAAADAELLGYAQLDGGSLEVAADAATAGPLLDAALALRGDLQVWSHGTRSPLPSVLTERGFRQARLLHQLRRDLHVPIPQPAVPEGVRLRTFVQGQDEQAWVAVNAAAFATHPEQGAWTVADLLARETEPWFDPSGFLLAERDGSLVGFHWTKVHADGRGEVYVLAVAPEARGLRLGATLLAAGLRLLADHGCPEALLYVDGDNATAMRLYERAGFVRHDIDIQWRRPADWPAGS